MFRLWHQVLPTLLLQLHLPDTAQLSLNLHTCCAEARTCQAPEAFRRGVFVQRHDGQPVQLPQVPEDGRANALPLR